MTMNPRVSLTRVLDRHAPIVERQTNLPPLPQQFEHLGRQHHMAIFAPFGLHDADYALCLLDVADLEPDSLAGT